MCVYIYTHLYISHVLRNWDNGYIGVFGESDSQHVSVTS